MTVSDKTLADLGHMLYDEYMACNVDYYNLARELEGDGLKTSAATLTQNSFDECKHFMRVKNALYDALTKEMDEKALDSLFG